MKKIVFAIYFAFTSSIAFCQGILKVEPFFSVERSYFPRGITLGNYDYEGAEASSIELPALEIEKFGRVPTSTGSSTGFYLGTGVMLEYPVTKKISFRGGIAYANRHFKAIRIDQCIRCTADDEDLDSYPTKTIFRLSYVDIPMSARYYVLSKRISLYTDAGLTTSPRVHNETVIEKYSSMSKPENVHVRDAPFHEVMLMAQFGIGAGVKMKNGGINISGIYRNGITKFAAADDYRFKSWGMNLAAFFRIGNSN